MVRHLEGGKSVQLMKGDITQVPVDAICNAANSELRGGGGVDGAIHRAGGPSIMAELDQIRRAQGGCPTGSAVATSAGSLPASWVFHAVGPIYHDGSSGEPEALASAYRRCLELAQEKGVARMSFPSISTGVYGYPVREAALIAMKEVVEGLRKTEKLQTIVFVLFDDRTHAAYAAALSGIVP